MNIPMKRLAKNYYVQYTISFLILFTACFFWFGIYNKSFFRTFDGLDQHYLIFLYIGKWFRDVLKNIFIYHEFAIPMWDMSMGYGSDIFPTLGLYFPDPFNWISLFFPVKYAELGFDFSLFLKFYFTGIAFSYYGFNKGYDRNITLFGSILYTFSATMYIAFIEAPFINPMYIFPFLIIGIDKIFKYKSPKLYILSLGFAFINYFYFAYMMCIFAVGYCVIFYFTEYKENREIKNFALWVLRFTGYTIVAISLSMVILLPILGMLVGQDRLSSEYYLPLFYPFGFYGNLLLGWLSAYEMSGRDAIVGFGAISILGITYLFFQKNRFTKEKLQFLLLTVILCIPALGSLMNGFSYYANRWVWAYCLCVVNIVCITLPEYKNIDKTILHKIVMVLALYFGITSLCVKYNIVQFITTILLVTAILLFIYKANELENKKFQYGLIAFAMICVTVQSYYWFNEEYSNATYLEVERGTALESILNGSGLPVLSDISRDEGVRFDEYALNVQTNANWISEAYGTDLYISLYNNDIVNFHNSLALNTAAEPQRIFGLNRRSELEYLAGTKYYLIPEGRKSLLPLGYTKLDRTQSVNGTNISRYSNPDSVPMIFGYYKTISQKKYDELKPYERQQLLMKACVIENSESTRLPNLSNDEVKFTEVLSDNIVKNSDKTYTVKENGTELILRVKAMSDCELYVYFENLNLVQDKEDVRGDFSIYVRAQNEGKDISDIGDAFAPRTNRTHMYAGKDDWMVNLGFTSEQVDTVIIKFNNAGTYRIDDLKVYSKPSSEIYKSILGLKKITNFVQLGTNQISANVNTANGEYIYIAVPYSKGWRAELDGKNVKIEKANGAFMAIKAEEGNHYLKMTFVTPHLMLGGIVSALSLVILFIIDRRYKKGCARECI